MWDPTVVECYCAIQPRFPETKKQLPTHINAHTHTPTHAAHTLCLELWVPQFTKEQGCFMCVWLSLFQLAWNSRSRSESLYIASRGGLDLVCEHSTPTFCGCTWLSECVCLRSWWQPTSDLLHLSCHNRCIELLPVEDETVSVLVKSPGLILGFIIAPCPFCLKLCFLFRCLLIQNRLNQPIGLTSNACVLAVPRCPVLRVFEY